jgi:tetratricopeptide (TPR) repeat protein
LNDDTLLEKISFTSVEKIAPTSTIPSSLSSLDPSDPTPLDPLDSTILLALTTCIKNTNPSDGLTMEEMTPYVARVLSHPRNWTVYTMALLLRTRLEHTRARTIQRSVLQLQVLVDQLVDEIGPPSNGITAPKSSFLSKPSNPSETASTRIRLAYAWQLLLPSRWDLEAELAQRWISIGALKTALEIFERLEMWDKVAICWAGTGRKDRAATVLREQLEKTPSDANLWSLLGDVEENPEYWEKAWDVSGGRYARAKRALGSYYFHLKEHDKARDAFKLSLKINPLNHVAWFTYGCASLESMEYKEACEAFSRCVLLDPQDSESWSNLATGLLKLDRKRDAWQALKQATAGNYENWKIWQNYMFVSIDVGEFPEAVRSLKRVIDVLGEKNGESCLDVEVVEIMVQRALQDDPAEERGVGKQVLELFLKNIVPLITTSPQLWNSAAKLYLWRGSYSNALDASVKAFRTYLNHPGLETDTKVWEAGVEEAERLVDAYRNLGERPGRMGGMVCKDWKYQARSALRGLKGRGKVRHEGTAGWEKIEELLVELKN